jgi:2-methylcitrate dehydratase PrpD
MLHEGSMTLLDELAAFAVDTDFASVPSKVLEEVERACLNWLACAVGGSESDATSIALRSVQRTSSLEQATVFGRDSSVDIINAAFLNCLSASVDAFDDTDAEMMLHPTSPVASAAFAVAEHLGLGGREFLPATLIGMEIEYRLCRMLSTAPRMGFYLSGLTGVVGAAAAASILLKANRSQVANAMAIAAVGAAGFQEALSSMACPFVPANASKNAILAALLAVEGFTGTNTAIEGARGFGNVFSNAPDYTRVTRNLGIDYNIGTLTYKPYPCGIVIHPALDACLELTAETAIASEEIVGIDVAVAPITIGLCGSRRHPKDELEAQVSAHHWIAAALVRGKATIDLISPDMLTSPEIARLRDMVDLKPDEGIRRDEVLLTVRTPGGRARSCHIEHCKGSLANPMTQIDLNEKFRSYGTRAIGRSNVDRLIDVLTDLANLDDVRLIGRLARSYRG